MQVIADRKPGGDDDVPDLYILGLKDPVHDQRVAELAANDPGGTGVLRERRHRGARVGDEEDLAVVRAHLGHAADDALIRDDDVIEVDAVLRARAEDDRVQDTRRVARDDRRGERLERERLRDRRELDALLLDEELLAEPDVLEGERVVVGAQRGVVAAERLDLGDRLPGMAEGRADAAQDPLDRDEQLGRTGRGGPDETRVAGEQEHEARGHEEREWPEKRVTGALRAPGATETGHQRLFNAADAGLSLGLARQRRVCLHNETALVVGELLQDLAAAADDAGERVVGDVYDHLGRLGHPRVEAAQQRAAAGQVDALVHDVGDELRWRLLDGVLDRVDDLLDRGVDRLADLRARDLDRSRQAGQQIAAAEERRDLFVERIRRADRDLDVLGGPFAHEQVELASGVGNDVLVHLIAADADRSRHDD